MDTLESAREYLDKNLDDGVACPCCGQHAKKYRRKINKIMAAGLIGLVREFDRTKTFVHVHDIPLGDRDVRSMGGSFAMLAHWGLIEPKVNDNTKKRCSGFWRPTKAGIAFAWKQGKVAAYGVFYNNTALEWSAAKISIVEALGREFDYAELMGGE